MSKKAKREAFRGRGAPLEGGRVRKSKTKIAGQEFSPCAESISCSDCKANRRSRRIKRDEAAAKNEDYKGSDIENQLKRKDGR